jgi:hypothetical protein
MTTSDWVTISSLATAAGTMILAVATFSSVRSANHAARVAERSFEVALRPILAPSRLEDPEERIMFSDRRWVVVPGGQVSVELVDDVVYLAMQVRNIGNGMAVIEAWLPFPGLGTSNRVFDEAEFRMQSRSLWVPPGDVGFWQGALRDPSEPVHGPVVAALHEGVFGAELLYRDHEGGQLTISRFSFIRDDDGERWWASLASHRSVTSDRL